MTVQEIVYCTKSYTNFSVHYLPKYCVSVIYTLIYRHDVCIKCISAFNKMQQTGGIRLNNIPYDITLIYVTYF